MQCTRLTVPLLSTGITVTLVQSEDACSEPATTTTSTVTGWTGWVQHDRTSTTLSVDAAVPTEYSGSNEPSLGLVPWWTSSDDTLVAMETGTG